MITLNTGMDLEDSNIHLLRQVRHVILPKNMLKVIPRDYFNSETGTLRILLEQEWRGLGITQSLGWEHYETHGMNFLTFSTH